MAISANGKPQGGGGGSGGLDTDEVDVRVARIVGAMLGVPLTMRDDAVLAIENVSLTDNLLETPDPLIYVGGAGTITLPVPGDFNDLSGGSFALGDRFLWIFTGSDREASGVYSLTDLGSAGTPAVWTRAADFDSSGDFVAGAAVLARTFEGVTGLYRLNVGGSFTLNSDPVKFDLIDPAWVVTAGTP